MSYGDNLAPGVALADLPGIFDEDDPVCDCDHPQSEHLDSWSECSHEEDEEICGCHGFTPPDAY